MRPVRWVWLSFRHEHKLGNARADQLFARVKVELKDELKKEKRPPRSKDDYTISQLLAADLPEGVTRRGMGVAVYAEEDLLSISALQHLLFCPRQCALIHVERLMG